MQRSEVDTEFEHNASGCYNSTQAQAMIVWFLRLVLIFCIGGLILAYNTPGIWRGMVASVAIVILAANLWQYGADLFLSVPAFTVDNVSKEIRQFRGPKRYDVVIGENKMRLRALSKAQWQLVQDGVTYKIYYSPRTKWLLSFKPLPTQN